MDCVLTEYCNKTTHYILWMCRKLWRSVVQYGQGGFMTAANMHHCCGFHYCQAGFICH